MARSSLSICVDQRTPLVAKDGVSVGTTNTGTTRTGRQLLRKAIRQLEGILGGVVNASEMQIVSDGAQPVGAFVTAALASVQANDTMLINGSALTAVSGTPGANQFKRGVADIDDATSMALALNTSTNTAIIVQHVEASNWAASVTLLSCPAGAKLFIGGHEFRAVAAAGNSPNVFAGDFSIASSDTNDATALKNAINTHPVLCHSIAATSSSGVVTLRQRRGTAALYRLSLGGVVGTGLVITTQFAATDTVLISALDEDVTGNAITSSSTGGTITVSGTRLTGGTGAGTGTRSRFIVGSIT